MRFLDFFGSHWWESVTHRSNTGHALGRDSLITYSSIWKEIACDEISGFHLIFSLARTKSYEVTDETAELRKLAPREYKRLEKTIAELTDNGVVGDTLW